MVPGPPKRFAQAVGLVLTLAATGFLVAGYPLVTGALLGVLLAFAALESVVGFCAGCWVFAQLMRVGLVPSGRLRGVCRHLPAPARGSVRRDTLTDVLVDPHECSTPLSKPQFARPQRAQLVLLATGEQTSICFPDR